MFSELETKSKDLLDLNELETWLNQSPLAEHKELLLEAVSTVLSNKKHGDIPKWNDALSQLPPARELPEFKKHFNEDIVGFYPVGGSIDPAQLALIQSALQQLIPWRKGPFKIGELLIDTEWRSDMKWRRLKNDISTLKGKTILDVGCGSGYHMWRMLGDGADWVLGIDPSPLFVMQFRAIQHFAQQKNTALLPLKMEELPPSLQAFDTVFSMGVLYHRRDPHEHLTELHRALKKDGELVLETLIIPGEEEIQLVPEERYARMRNVWCLPSKATLAKWLLECGFGSIRFVSEEITSTDEQRTTDWMPYESLQESLSPKDSALTIEGHPAPRRVIVTAKPNFIDLEHNNV